ncbi:MAG: hypothetical protein KF745_08300 [Phycisphaeraceae bacterium]|nr:hypothetical protein [Phycisphaeraceae bacterium]
MFIAYGAGLVAVCWRNELSEARYYQYNPVNMGYQAGEPLPWHLVRVPESLTWLVPEFSAYAFYRYPSWMLTNPGFYETVLLVVLGGATAGFLASAWIPAAAALPHLRGVRSSERRRAGREWGVMLRRSPPCRRTIPRWLWLGAATVGGLSIALFGDAWARTVGHLRLEAAWARGAPGSVVYMKPVLGCLATPDAIAVIAWAIVLPLGIVWLTTREAFMAREARIGKRCQVCGYPKTSGSVRRWMTPCSECGARPGATGHLRRARFRAAGVLGWALGGVLVLALTAFCVGPHLTG